MKRIEKQELFHVDYCGAMIQELDIHIEQANVENLLNFIFEQIDRHQDNGLDAFDVQVSSKSALGRSTRDLGSNAVELGPNTSSALFWTVPRFSTNRQLIKVILFFSPP